MNNILCAILLSISVYFVPPVSVYLGNAAEYNISLLQLISVVLIPTALSTLILYLLLQMLMRFTIVYKLFYGLFVSYSLILLISGQFLKWDIGVVDGRGFNWDNWQLFTQIELVGFSILILILWYASIKSFKTVFKIACWALAISTLSIVSASITAEPPNQDDTSNIRIINSAKFDEIKRKSYQFHETNNSIILILDTFQADIFNEIVERWPEEIEQFTGFTFFPNTVGGYPTTRVSVPLIFGGKFYQNEAPVTEWQKANINSKSIFKHYADRSYDISLISNGGGNGGADVRRISMSSVDFRSYSTIFKSAVSAFESGLFRALPLIIKPEVYKNGSGYFTEKFSGNEVPGVHARDVRFVEKFTSDARVGTQAEGAFNVYHLRAAHWPIHLNENFEYIGKQKGIRENYISQSRGALRLVEKMFEKLKSLGVYDNAQIMIVGDHGSLVIPPNDMLDADSSFSNTAVGKLVSSARPLFMYKPSIATGPMEVSNSAMHLGDVACVMSDFAAMFNCEIDSLDQIDNNRVRRFLHYNWGAGFWSKTYMPKMTEYHIKGDVRKYSSWSKSSFVYEKE